MAIYVRRSTGNNFSYYLHRDHLGSPELITNASGNSVVKLSFSAYGERRDVDWDGPIKGSDLTAATNVTRHGYTDHLHLDSVQLIHMGGRVYDPVIGRFLSRDPYIDGVQSSQGANGYAYVWNNPLSRWDPTGYGGTHENFAVWANSGRWERRIVNGQEEFVLTDRQSYWELTSSLIAHEFRLALIGSGASGSGGELGGSGSGGRGAGAPEGSKEEEPQSDPCNGLAGAVQEFTGGDNGLGWGEWWDSTASNYSDTIDFNVMSIGDYGVGLDTPIAMGAAPFVAQTWGGVTPGQALSQIVAAARATIQTPGLIGFRTPLQLTATFGASWLWNAAVAKGSYRVGVGAGSGLRAGVNQLVTYACSKQD